MSKVEKSIYGKKRIGNSRFLIVAPHAAGDDLGTGIIAYWLAKKLDAFLVQNNTYKKPSNSRAKSDPEHIEDFNRLSWSYTKKKYLCAKKHPAMRAFFKDINEYSKQARELCDEKKCIAVHIHGMTSKTVGVDIGVGAKKSVYTDMIYGARAYNLFHQNNGKITMRIRKLKMFGRALEKNVKSHYTVDVTIGKHYSGWSKMSAIQFHKHEGRNDYAIQLELNQTLRAKEHIDKTVNILYKSLITLT